MIVADLGVEEQGLVHRRVSLNQRQFGRFWKVLFSNGQGAKLAAGNETTRKNARFDYQLIGEVRMK